MLMWALAWSLLQPRFQYSWDAVCRIQIQNECIFTNNNTFISLNIRYLIYVLCPIESTWTRRFRWGYSVFIKLYTASQLFRNHSFKKPEEKVEKKNSENSSTAFEHLSGLKPPWQSLLSLKSFCLVNKVGNRLLWSASGHCFHKKSKLGRD